MSATFISIDKAIEEWRPHFQKTLNDAGAARAYDFLTEKKFCLGGQLAVAHLVLGAIKRGLTIDSVMDLVESEYERIWKLQQPDVRADPDAPGLVGIHNRESIQKMVALLDLPQSAR
jgi:hypothetical protein